MEKFTKGPWRLVQTADGAIVEMGADADHLSGNDLLYMNEDSINAALIAAAPEMYKFLKDIASGNGVDYPIEQLLAKARGE